MSADRNLLFGILALQMDFVSREALIAGMHAWVLEKQTPLAEILQRQGVIAIEARNVLEPLVQLHLQQHGNDPEKSLAALSSIEWLGDEVIQIHDTVVQSGIPAATRRRGDDPLQTTDFRRPSSGLRFRILRPHAKGGLGEVFVAHDEELHREVALKEIRNERAQDAESRARFVLEAEITGGLEHPGIVPVYGLGSYANGRPFYAMRFIRGNSLKEAIERYHRQGTDAGSGDRSSLTLRQLLARFMDVCQAMAYAHSRGVLHRDLKPANIMLGKYGETLVVDWGLAKAKGQHELAVSEAPLEPSAGSGGTPTAAGQVLGTLAYMSPEQARGELERLGPASDVYSLGATLYEVLAGRPPVAGASREAVLRDVQAGRVTPLPQVKPATPKALEAICLKALSFRPEDRYASALDLAAAIEHWLADEPVTAYRETILERAGRWTRKHRTLAASGVLVLLAVAVGTGLIAIERERARDRLALEQAETEKQRREALTARDQARERLRLALDAFDTLVNGIQNKLQVRPGTQDLRVELLRAAQQGLRTLLAAADPGTGGDSTLVWSHLRMGDVAVLLGETDQARQEYEQGKQLAEVFSAADPQNIRAQRDLSVSHIKLGNVQLRLGHTQAALDAYQESLKTFQALAVADPKSHEAQLDVSFAYEKLSAVHLRLGQTQAALDALHESLKIRQVLAAADPNNSEAQRDLLSSRDALGDIHLRLGQTQEALHVFRDALKLAQALAAADPKSTQAQRDLSISINKLGDAHWLLGDTKAALAYFRDSLKIFQALAAADPKDTNAQRQLSVAHDKLGDVHLRTGHFELALDAFQQGTKIRQTLVAADPKNTEAKRNLSVSLEKLGDVYVRLGQLQTAIDVFGESLKIRQPLAAVDPKNAQLKRDLLLAHVRLGTAYLDLGQAQAALEAYGESLKIAQALAAADPKNTDAQADLGYTLGRLAACEQKQCRYAEALAWHRQGLTVLRKLDQEGRIRGQSIYQQWLKTQEREQMACEHADHAAADLDFVLKQPDEQRSALLDVRVRYLLHQGKVVEAAATAKVWSEKEPVGEAYNAACAWALCAAKATEPARQEYLHQSLEQLRRAKAAKYFDNAENIAQLMSDRDLAGLREQSVFQEFLKSIEAKKE